MSSSGSAAGAKQAWNWLIGNNKKKSAPAPASSGGKSPFNFGPQASLAQKQAETQAYLDNMRYGPETGPYRDPNVSYDSPPNTNGGGGGGGGGGYARPVFDTTPFDAARGRITTQSDAARKFIAQMQAELATRLTEQAATYQQAADKVKTDMSAQAQGAQQTTAADAQKVQQDLQQQGVAAQGVAAQAQAQEQARAQAAARQQDYAARLAQLAAQNQADRKVASETMFGGLNSQAELLKSQQLGAIDAEQAKALAAFEGALRGRGGGGGGRGGGGGGRGGGGGGGGSDSFDPTQAQVWNMNQWYERNENDPYNRMDQAAGFAMTPYAQSLARIALTEGPGVAEAKWLADRRAYDSGNRGAFGPNWVEPRAYAQNVDRVLDEARRYWGANQYIVNAPTRESQLRSYGQLVNGGGGSQAGNLRRNPRR